MSGIIIFIFILEQTDGCNMPGCSVELSYARRLFATVLQGLSSVLEKRSTGQRGTWVAVMWAVRDLLRIQAAHLLVWLLSPYQPVKIRTFVVHTLRTESQCKELLSNILHTHAQVITEEIKCTYFGTSKRNFLSWIAHSRISFKICKKNTNEIVLSVLK